MHEHRLGYECMDMDQPPRRQKIRCLHHLKDRKTWRFELRRGTYIGASDTKKANAMSGK